MSSVADLYFVERRALLERLRSAFVRFAGNRTLVLAAGILGLLTTFAVMVATDDVGRIGTISYVPWVALLAAELGPPEGSLAGVAQRLFILQPRRRMAVSTMPWRSWCASLPS
jgi:hypothetical protein